MINKLIANKSLAVFSLLLIVWFNTSCIQLKAQQYILQAEKSSITIRGTSNLHDWEMKATDFSGKMMIKSESGRIQAIYEVYLSVSSESVVSNSKIMNSKAHDALKSEQFPRITYESVNVSIDTSTANIFIGKTTGIVNIAGKSIQVIIPFKGTINGNGILQAKGEFSLTMTSFNINPPTALFGGLKTGDKIIINYDFIFKRVPTN